MSRQGASLLPWHLPTQNTRSTIKLQPSLGALAVRPEISNHTPTDYDYYIGRPSVLSNPYTHKEGAKYAKMKVNSRDEAISLYGNYFNNKVDS